MTEGLKAQSHSECMYFVSRLSDEDLRLCHYAASVFFPFVTKKKEAFCVPKTEMMFCCTPVVTLPEMLEKMEKCYREIKGNK